MPCRTTADQNVIGGGEAFELAQKLEDRVKVPASRPI